MIDSIPFSSSKTVNLSIALQQNVSTGDDSYPGLDFLSNKLSPKILDIKSISFEFRTKFCADPRGNSDKANEMSHATTYFGFYSQKLNFGKEIAINLFDRAVLRDVKKDFRVPFPVRIEAESEIGGLPHMSNTFHVNGKAFGFVPRELDYDYDHSPDCSTPIEQSQ